MSLRLSGGRRLLSPPGSLARPTASRVRQAVMNVLAGRLPGCHWLDLCCGSGVIGCEALQRGAARLVAVERDARIAAVARQNLEAVARALEPQPQWQVLRQEVLRWLAPGCQARDQAAGFDLIYADPPYRAGLYAELAAAVRRGGWLRPDGLLVLECGSECVPPTPEGWRSVDQRRYGGSTVLLLAAADKVALQPQHQPQD